MEDTAQTKSRVEGGVRHFWNRTRVQHSRMHGKEGSDPQSRSWEKEELPSERDAKEEGAPGAAWSLSQLWGF